MTATSLGWRLLLTLTFCSCTTTERFPLCPKIAALSYPSREEGKGQVVNKFVKDEALRRDVSIVLISNFVAELKGSRRNIAWFESNYPSLLCAFNPGLVIEDEATHTSCHSHVRNWMEMVKNQRENELMLEKNLFCPNCCGN